MDLEALRTWIETLLWDEGEAIVERDGSGGGVVIQQSSGDKGMGTILRMKALVSAAGGKHSVSCLPY